MVNVAVNALRARSGGARAHLVGIFSSLEPAAFGFANVHVWSYAELLDALPAYPWLTKHLAPCSTRSIVSQLLWERYWFPRVVRAARCQILLNVDAGTVAAFAPAVTISRDMLSYEPGEMSRYGLTKARLRLLLLRFAQNRSLSRSEGAIFLTQYASRVIQACAGPSRRFAVIPHGVAEGFRRKRGAAPVETELGAPVRILYVSNAAWYKHQWHVVEAVSILRSEGFNATLELVGGGTGQARARLDRQIRRLDPLGEFVRVDEFVPHNELPDRLAAAEVFVFASSCENMPNTLVEAMASGLPIACSNRGPMPEVLRDAGVYFDPENPAMIASALRVLLRDRPLRARLGSRAATLAQKFSWTRCANETFTFLADVAKEHGIGPLPRYQQRERERL